MGLFHFLGSPRDVCIRCGESYPIRAKHTCPIEKPSNELALDRFIDASDNLITVMDMLFEAETFKKGSAVWHAYNEFKNRRDAL